MSITNKHHKSHKSIFSEKSIGSIKKSGLYEVWFTMLNKIETGESFWIRYTLLIPKQTNRNLQGNGLLWFGYTNQNKPQENFMIKKFYPIEEVHETTSNYIIKIADSLLTISSLDGAFQTESGKNVFWDLELSEFMDPYISTPYLAKRLRITDTLNYATHPNVRIDGIIRIDNTEVRINKSPGIQYHTFGEAYTTPWEWISAHTFSGKPSAYLDLGYKVDKGIVEIFDGSRSLTSWNSNVISKLRMSKKIQRIYTETQLKFSLHTKSVDLTGNISCEKENLLGVEYLGPKGGRFYCYNTALANLEAKFHSKNHEFNESITGSVAFETVYTEPINGIPYLPWEAEYI